MKWIKRSLAILLATSGMMLYEQGNVSKSVIKLKRALNWAPDVLKGSIFEGYLGLALSKTGEIELAIKHLKSASERIPESISADSDKIEIELAVLREVDTVLRLVDT